MKFCDTAAPIDAPTPPLPMATLSAVAVIVAVIPDVSLVVMLMVVALSRLLSEA